MQRFALLLLLTALFANPLPGKVSAQTPAVPDKILAPYRDKNRVLLVFAPTAQDPAYVEQLKLWKNEKAQFEDRQLVVVPLLADAKPAESAPPITLARKYGVEPKNFAVILIGKDGHDAFRASKPVKAEALYGVIDAMPMRRLELKRAQNAPSAAPSAAPRKPDLDHDE
jgi:hypothetical protein